MEALLKGTSSNGNWMRNLLLFFGLLLGYTFVYTGLSKFWHGVTAIPSAIPGSVP